MTVEATGQGLCSVFVSLLPHSHVVRTDRKVLREILVATTTAAASKPQITATISDSPQQSENVGIQAITLIRKFGRDLFRLFFNDFLGTVCLYYILTRGDDAKT